jgi:hypothetical protein
MKNTAIVILSALLLLMDSCGSGGCDPGPQEVRMRVNHYQVPGVGEGTFLNLLVQDEAAIGTDDWTSLTRIEGFEYENGYLYDLLVRKENSENPLADASAIKYIWVKTINKEKVSSEVPFQVRLSRAYSGSYESYITGDANTGYKLLNLVNINCGGFCGSLSENLNNHQSMLGTFHHEGADIKLIDLTIEK